MEDHVNTPEISITPPEEPAGFPLNKQFLEIAFEKEVESFVANIGTNPGDNYLSIIHAVEVLFKGEKEPKHYLLKCYPNHPGRRDFLDKVNVFDKEFLMYDDFLPQLKEIVDEREAKDAAISTAPFHGGNIVASPSKRFEMEPWCDQNFILMTDLRKTEGCRMANRIEGLDWEHGTLTLKEIAKFHALSWAYKQKHGLDLLSTKYPSMVDQMYTNDELILSFKQLMNQMSANAVTMVGEAIGTEHPAYKNFKTFILGDVIELMKKYTPPNGIDEEIVEQCLRTTGESNGCYKGSYTVLTHGDSWLNNILFQYDSKDPKKPKKAILVDFQICREACPTLDLVYFLFTSIRASIRVPRQDELLQVYYDAFISACKSLKVEPLPGFTFENLKRKYRMSKLFGLVVSLPLLSIVLKPPEESIDMDKGKGEDISELFSSVLEGSEKNLSFKAEITAIVLDLYADGVL